MPGLVKYRTEFVSLQTKQAATWDGADADKDADVGETAVMEYVEVRLTQLAIGTGSDAPKLGAGKGYYHSHSKGHSYITIFSPAVNEALRCVVDYYPSVDLAGNTVKVMEPFAMLVFFERELAAYRDRLARPPDGACANRHAYEHIGIVQEFVRSRVQKDVDAERERHARGFVSFDMLWLLYKPGSDIYYDHSSVVEHEPYVLKEVDFKLADGTTNKYDICCWNMRAAGGWVGPCEEDYEVQRFAGEIEIVKLRAYPCEYLKLADGLAEEDAEKIREHFIARGKKWYRLWRGRRCYDFDGFTTSFPRRRVSSITFLFGNQRRAHAWGLTYRPACLRSTMASS